MTARRDDAAARLTTLLDRLAAELLSASDAEMEAALRETGRVREAALQEIKGLLNPSPGGAPDRAGPVGGSRSALQARRPIGRH